MNDSIELIGRETLVRELMRRLERGETVLVHGPVGSGKTVIGEMIVRRARDGRRAAGRAERTNRLVDFGDAYPGATRGATSARRALSRLREVVEARPGVVVLDHLGQTGTAFKGALRSLRGTGLGILLLADVDAPRDHARVRALGLTQHELPLPRLHANTIRTILRRALASEVLPRALDDEELAAFVSAAEGLPGRAIAFAKALANGDAWLAGRPRVAWLKSEAAIAAASRYLA